MEDDYAAGTDMRGYLSEHHYWIGLKHEDIPTNDCIERLFECHVGGIALVERKVAERQRARPLPCDRQSLRGSINTDDLARFTNQFCSQEGHVTGTTTNVKHTHPGDNPRGIEEPARYRVNEAGLHSQTVQFSIRMTQHIALRRSSFIVSANGIAHFSPLQHWYTPIVSKLSGERSGAEQGSRNRKLGGGLILDLVATDPRYARPVSTSRSWS